VSVLATCCKVMTTLLYSAVFLICSLSHQVYAECPDLNESEENREITANKVCFREIVINENYTLRYHYLDFSHDRSTGIEILLKGKRVYYESGEVEEGRHDGEHLDYFIIDPVDNRRIIPSTKEKIPVIDVTGEGNPTLVVLKRSRGLHCCSSDVIFSLGKTFRKIVELPAYHSPYGFGFKDIDGDGTYELIGNDWTFAYWNTSFARSPSPHIILHYVNGKYELAIKLMKKTPPSQEEIESKLSAIKNRYSVSWEHQDGKWAANGSVPSELWDYMLDLIYSGNGHIALDFFNKAWPQDKEGKEDFLRAFMAQLNQSEYARSIMKMNDWITKSP